MTSKQALPKYAPETQPNINSNRLQPTDSKQLSPRKKQVLGWILLMFILAVISWVCVFTITSNHTEFARESVYPFFESKYFPEKSGARLFTYLGLFYWIAGTVTLSFLTINSGFHLPKPSHWLVRSFRFPFLQDYWSVLEISGLAIFLLIQCLAISARVYNRFDEYWKPERVWYEVSKTLGKTLALFLMVLLVPVSKNCFWLYLFNLQFERAVKIHRLLAWLFTFVLVVHAIVAIVSLSMVDQFKNCMWPNEDCEKPGGWGSWHGSEISRILMYGWMGALCFLPLAITSMPWFRRHKFEWFYYAHFMFVPFIIFAHLHFKDMIYYMAPGLAAYTLDKVAWWCSTRIPSQIVSLTSPSNGFVRMQIAADSKFSFEPGAWVQIKVPAISKWQWHPMSVASAPGHDTITIDIKVLGDWTRDLAGLVERFDPSVPSHTCVFVDKFYGSSHTQNQGYLNHPVVVMFAGGIGVTPMISAIQNLAEHSERFPHIRRATLVWCVKRKSCLKLYRDQLERLKSSLAEIHPSTGLKIKTIVHCTLSEPQSKCKIEKIRPNNFSISKQEPLRQHLFGYPHLLVLLSGSAGGSLLGIFVANVLAYENGWLPELLSMLQLCLSILLAAVFVAIGMSEGFLRVMWRLVTPPEQTGKSDAHSDRTLPTESDACESGNKKKKLHVQMECRPDVEAILEETRSLCVEKGYSSVGVAVCGPDMLVQCVMANCQKASATSLPFVVDEETFEW